MHGWSGHGHSRGNNWLPLVLLVGFLVLSSTLRFPWWAWMLFFFVGLPMVTRVLHRVSGSATRHGNWNQNHGHRYSKPPQQNRTPWDMPREKRKNGYRPQRVEDIDDMLDDMGGEYTYEKPKRRPIYVVGDDGELVEMTEEPLEEKPKAKRAGGNEDGYEYV